MRYALNLPALAASAFIVRAKHNDSYVRTAINKAGDSSCFINQMWFDEAARVPPH